MNEEFTGKTHGWQKDFHLLYLEQEQEPLLFLDRPAYYQELASDSDELGVMLYDGGRWQVLRSDLMDGWDSYKSTYSGTARDLAEFIKYEFLQDDLLVSTICLCFYVLDFHDYEMMSNHETSG
jgi:hypothetical protein